MVAGLLKNYWGYDMHTSFFWLTIIAFSFMFVIFGVVAPQIQEKFSSAFDYRSRSLMTAREREFFALLRKALPDVHIFPQVAMSAVIDSNSKGYAVRNRFDRKVFDYVVCSESCDLLYVIELDDRSHLSESSRKRDAVKNEICALAGVQLLRYPSVKIDCVTIQADFDKARLLKERVVSATA
jgi:hypothetical protein